MLATLCYLLGMGLLWSMGSHHGRSTERRLHASGRTSPLGITPLSIFEADLRRRKGLRRLHPDPESAGRQLKARIHR